jgi:putative transposase
MAIDTKLIDQLLSEHGHRREDIVGETGLLKQLTKALLERVMQAEMTNHLGYEKHDPAGYKTGNSRNGKTKKKLTGEFGQIELETPRDREGSFEPQMIAKHQTRFDGFDDKIISMYSRGMTTREIQGHLEEIYGVDVSPALVSQVTEEVQDEVRQWQIRPLASLYPILFLDALRVRMRDNGHVQNRAVYVAIGIGMEGKKEVLGLWSSDNEGAKFWLQVLTEIHNRGVKDIFISCVDGLKGFPDAIEKVFSKSLIQLCIVHLVRNSLEFVSWKQRKQVAADLRTIYTAPTEQAAELALNEFAAKWDKSHRPISQIWRSNWSRIIPFFQFPPEIRKIIYTTNAIESLNMSLRKIIKTRGSFPNEESAFRLLYLALRNHSKKWTTVQGWREALNRFQLLWPDRMPPLERQ